MANRDSLPLILTALAPETVAAVIRDLSGHLASTDQPTSVRCKAMGRALATIRAHTRAQAASLREASGSATIRAQAARDRVPSDSAKPPEGLPL